jgi:hypothetical protein
VVDGAFRIDIRQRFEGKLESFLFQSYEGRDGFLYDPSSRAIQALCQAIQFLGEIGGKMGGHDTGIHMAIVINQNDSKSLNQTIGDINPSSPQPGFSEPAPCEVGKDIHKSTL